MRMTLYTKHIVYTLWTSIVEFYMEKLHVDIPVVNYGTGEAEMSNKIIMIKK